MPKIACFCMPDYGHVMPVSTIASALITAGAEVHVLCGKAYRSSFEVPDDQFHDLFSDYPLDDADAHSSPIPCRYVSFAGHYGGAIIELVRALDPDLILHDIFAVIAIPVAHALGLTRVCITAGHNHAPGPALANLQVGDPRVSIHPACHQAVSILRELHGMPDASPFSYVTGLSKALNLLPEPRQFLHIQECEVFEPCAFFGSLHSRLLENLEPALERRAQTLERRDGRRLLFVSFGTLAWQYFSTAAFNLLISLDRLCERRKDLDVLVSLGGHQLPAGTVIPANLQIETFVDQWEILQQADWFLTHQGLNSTHEAIALGVPMLSYPFFGDQPRLAARCKTLGLSVPLTDELRGAVSVTQLDSALQKLEANHEAMAEQLAQAREWEWRAAAERPMVIERVLSLCGRR